MSAHANRISIVAAAVLAVCELTAVSVLANPSSRQGEAVTKAANKITEPIPWHLDAGTIALLIGAANLGLYILSQRRGNRIAKAAQTVALSTTWLAEYRKSAQALLLRMGKTAEHMIHLEQCADYRQQFREMQNEFISAGSDLRAELRSISTDPDVSGDKWHEIMDDQYDAILDACNTVLGNDIPIEEKRRALTRVATHFSDLEKAVKNQFCIAFDEATRPIKDA